MTTIPDPQIYRAAADVIRRNGWRQGAFSQPGVGLKPNQRRVCAMGALRVAAGVAPWQHHNEASMAAVWLGDRFLRSAVVVWNDTEGRTVDEVLALLEQAATAAESALAAQDGGENRG